MRSSSDGKETNASQKNKLDSLPVDIQLHLSSCISTRDAIRVTSVSKANNKLLYNDIFWRQRIAMDFKFFSQKEANPRKYYINLHNSRIKTIRNLNMCALGFDNSGTLNISDTLFPDQTDEIWIINTISEFAEKNKIIDIRRAHSGTIYVLTDNGLFGFGNNNLCQLGIDTNGKNVDKIICVYPFNHDDKITNFACGMYFIVVVTEKTLWMAGQINYAMNYTPISIPLPADVVKMVSGSFKIAMQLSNNSFIAIDDRFFNSNKKQIEPLNIAHWVINEFCDKKIIDYFFSWRYMLVWCEDGIYIHSSEVHDHTRKADRFNKLNIFNDMNIINVCASDDHISVHCREGLYVTGLNKMEKIDPHKLGEFAEIDGDQIDIMNVKIDAWPYVEIGGKWHKAHIIESLNTAIQLSPNKLKAYFKPVEFIPLCKVSERVNELESEDNCRCRIF